MELRGVSCLPLEKCPPTKKSIGWTRSFPVAINELNEIREAVAVYTTRVAERLRQAGLAASAMFVFVETSSHASGPPHVGATTVKRSIQQFDAGLLSSIEALVRIYKRGCDVRRAGVILMGCPR